MNNYIEKLINDEENINMEDVNINDILNTTLDELECFYNHETNKRYFNIDYVALIETIICQLARHKPKLDKYNGILFNEDLEEDSPEWNQVIEDIKYIEGTFYTDFINNIPLKYWDDEVALRTLFNDYLDYLNKQDIIGDYIIDNFDYEIIPSEPNRIS